ncbi:hypothetical protein [Nodularia sp. LEGE 04288]|uniref:hypothetical protein n=1 Tax=Nodularia sp. LEGE 04288 TaxID=1828639 RepID=UPI001D1128A6|nr:hypothetical protein [Nodularia sp. LEGE 04288]MCC2692871.1 hypothetical protein [Nodularia sp. LEGE 04288]
MVEIKLGLGNPPEPIYLYVNQGEVQGEQYVWYNYDIQKDKKIPVRERALTGYIAELRLTTKEYKGKDNLKLDIVICADEIYVVRSGIETNFTKTFLLAASQVDDFSKPLTIATTPGDENTVFCRLYYALNKSRIRYDWNPNADWAGIIQSIQSKLSGNQVFDFEEENIPKTKPQNVAPHPQDLRVKQVRTLFNYPVDLVKEWLQSQNVQYPSQLPVSEVDKLVNMICMAWASDKVDPNHAAASYQQQVIGVMSEEIDEVAAIRAWANYVLGQKTAMTTTVR